MKIYVFLILGFLFVLGSAACGDTMPDYPERNTQPQDGAVTEEIAVSADASSPSYSIKVKNSGGSLVTLEVFEGPGMIWVRRDNGGSLYFIEKVAALREINRRVNITGAKVENGPDVMNVMSYTMTVHLTPNSNEYASENGQKDVTIISGALLADTGEDEDSSSETENSKDENTGGE